MIFIIGSQGRLGRAIASSYPVESVTLIGRATYQGWWQQGSPDKISDFFTPYARTGSIIFVTSGILDSKAPHEDHLRVNYLLPKHIIEAAIKLGVRVVTFGTVMENLIKNKNSYIETKTMLGNFVTNLPDAEGSALHIRIHTLYGGSGLPSSFMFFGQIYQALLKQMVFKMTLGKQLREYHHIDDEVKAIHILVDAQIQGVIDLNHGDPVSLKDIASYIFKSIKSEQYLRIGGLPEPDEENYEIVFQRPEIINDVTFRDSLPATAAYIKDCLHMTKEPA